MDYHCSGWATRNNLVCSDGRTILRDAFKDNDGQTVPVVWNHQHNDPTNVLGKALLENREDGVYAYLDFNETDKAEVANEISIVADPYANKNFYAMKYVEFNGAKWKIEKVEVQYPRLILTLGGLYNDGEE